MFGQWYSHPFPNEVFILPFLRKKQEAAVSVPSVQHMGETSPLMSAASDLIQAIESKDEKGVAAALKKAFSQLEEEPDQESEAGESSEQQ